MAGAALLPGHGGFTSGQRMDFRIRGLKSGTMSSSLKLKTGLSVCQLSEMYVCWPRLCVDVSCQAFIDDKTEREMEENIKVVTIETDETNCNIRKIGKNQKTAGNYRYDGYSRSASL